VFDLVRHTLTVESPHIGGSEPIGDTRAPTISSDGRFLVFEWFGTSLGAADPVGYSQLMLRDRRLGTTRMLSVNGSGARRRHQR